MRTTSFASKATRPATGNGSTPAQGLSRKERRLLARLKKLADRYPERNLEAKYWMGTFLNHHHRLFNRGNGRGRRLLGLAARVLRISRFELSRMRKFAKNFQFVWVS